MAHQQPEVERSTETNQQEVRVTGEHLRVTERNRADQVSEEERLEREI